MNYKRMLEILYESKASYETAFDLIQDFDLDQEEIQELKTYWNFLVKEKIKV